MTTVVIAGASGFLGGALRNRLMGNGLETIAVSRRDLPGMHSVRDYTETPSGDFLIHCAESSDRPWVNGEGDEYLVHAAEVTSALSKRFAGNMIYASSGAVYGDESAQPHAVGTPVRGTDTYTSSKLLNEEIVLAAGGSVVRLSNLIGSGMSSSNILSVITRQIPGEGPVRVRDDKPVRDFLAVSDAASAFKLLIQSVHRGILNVGSGAGTSVRTLAELLLAAAGESGREVIATAPSMRRSVNILDVSPTRKILGWAPAVPLESELRRMVSGERPVQ